MAGQLWSVPAEGGYLYSDELSSVIRNTVQPLTKMRQFADAEDGAEKGLNAGENFTWDVVSNVSNQGGDLSETQAMPETNFTIAQRTMTVTEAGNSIPFTKKLQDLAKRDVVKIIDQALKHDATKYFDSKAYEQMKLTPLRVAPTGGNSTSSVTLSTGGTTAITNNIALGKDHVKPIVDEMMERNIPPYDLDDYYAIAHPTTLRAFKDDLETIHQYTDSGLVMIRHGEVGRYESVRFIQQNNVPKGGANDSTTFDSLNRTADEWDNALSSWCMFFGGDTVTEAIVIPEEIRGKLPGDYGRSRGIAWYYLGAFGLVHTDAENARVVMWDSAA